MTYLILQLHEWVQILATGLIVVSVIGICGIYDYKSKIITKRSGLTFGWLVHLGFNILLLGASRSRCKYYVLPWLIEGMLVTIGLGGLACYLIYSGFTNQRILFTHSVKGDAEVITCYYN